MKLPHFHRWEERAVLVKRETQDGLPTVSLQRRCYGCSTEEEVVVSRFTHDTLQVQLLLDSFAAYFLERSVQERRIVEGTRP